MPLIVHVKVASHPRSILQEIWALFVEPLFWHLVARCLGRLRSTGFDPFGRRLLKHVAYFALLARQWFHAWRESLELNFTHFPREGVHDCTASTESRTDYWKVANS